jgi:hypothetical protein
VNRSGAAALVQPGDEIAFEDASPARRDFNDGRSSPSAIKRSIVRCATPVIAVKLIWW